MLQYRQFADWFRTSHPQTAKLDDEEARQHRQALEQGLETSKERVGMAKRYERYKKEFLSRQVSAAAVSVAGQDSYTALCHVPHSPRFSLVPRAVLQ